MSFDSSSPDLHRHRRRRLRTIVGWRVRGRCECNIRCILNPEGSLRTTPFRSAQAPQPAGKSIGALYSDMRVYIYIYIYV